MIYLDHAATALYKPPGVAQAMTQALTELGNSGRGAHEATLQASRVIYETRQKLAMLFHAEAPECIAFTCNATESLNMAIGGLFASGDHVITTMCEHNSVLRPLYRLEKEGVQVSILQADEKGVLVYEQLEKLIQKNTKAMVVTHVSNLTGNRTDLSVFAELAQRYGLYLIVDASQSAGVLPIDVQEMGIDILCFTGHKGLMGPQGTGGIYVKEGISLRPWKVGGSGILSFERTHPSVMPTALEAGTLNGPGIAGLSAALDYILETGVDEIHRKEMKLAELFYKKVKELPEMRLYGDFSDRNRGAIVSCNLGDEDSGLVSSWLWEDYEIAVRAGAHCAPLMHQALGTQKQGAVRFSFSCFNTEEEVDRAASALKALTEE